MAVRWCNAPREAREEIPHIELVQCTSSMGADGKERPRQVQRKPVMHFIHRVKNDGI